MSGRRTRIKICGLTRAEDAAAAVRFGADMVGCVFAPSPRRVMRGQAVAVFSQVPSSVMRVGVFVDEKGATILDTARQLGLTALQLSGSETPEECRYMPLPVIKAIKVGDADVAEEIALFAGSVSAVLLDTHVAGTAGGTGIAFDWDAIESLPHDVPVIVAGGLTPENVGEAVRRFRPYAVDVSSGVETAPGIKDHAALEAFVAAVRKADEEA